MKSTVPVPPRLFRAFDPEVAKEVLLRIEEIRDSAWHHRNKINSIPTQGTAEADYDFLGDRQQPKDFNKFLRSLAPKIPGTMLGEACVNRYKVGGGMPEHVDIALYRYNVVVMLNDCGDGIEIEGVFYPDDPGMAIQFPDKSQPHRVPPVKHQRYVVIYLYE